MCLAGMRAARQAAIAAAAPARHWGVILGTLGRQGNPQLMATLQQKVATRGLQLTTVLLSEVTPPKLKLLGHVQAWVQVACPRLSIDWGEGFDRPTLTPYEALIALGEVPGWWERADSSSSSSSSGCGAVPQASSTAGACCPQPDAAAGAGGGCGTCGSRSTAAGGCKQQGAAVAPYPMDYYAKEGGAWNSSYHKLQQHRRPVVQSG
jgi:2-(3-amino-3-carboxypropyl)histidine synthase